MKNYLDEQNIDWNRRTQLAIAEAIEKKRQGEKIEKLVVQLTVKKSKPINRLLSFVTIGDTYGDTGNIA